MNVNNHCNNNSDYKDNDYLRNIQQCTTALERVKLSTEEYCTIQTRHQTALYRTSTWSSEENLQCCLQMDEEVQSYMVNAIDEDELPTFQIRLISPCSHSPSPISNVCPPVSSPTSRIMPNPTDNTTNESSSSFMCHNNTEFVALQDINAQISLPNEQNRESMASTAKNLETIYEGVFLHTPPRQPRQQRPPLQYQQRFERNRPNNSSAFLEKLATDIVVERGKENISPR